MQSMRLVRALDGICYSLIATLVITPRVLLNEHKLAMWDLVFLLPPLGLAIFSFTMPGRVPGLANWHRHLGPLRWFGLLAVGFAPFTIWWLGTQQSFSLLTDNTAVNLIAIRDYLMVNSFLAGLFVILWFIRLNNVTIDLAGYASHPGVELEARFNRYFLIYGLLGFYLALSSVLVFTSFKGGNAVFEDIYTFAKFSTWNWVIVFPLMPVLLSLTLLFRVRRAVIARITLEAEEAGASRALASDPSDPVGTSPASAPADAAADDDAPGTKLHSVSATPSVAAALTASASPGSSTT